MQIDVEHPEFKTVRLAVETAGFFRGPRLLVNGSVAEKDKVRYSIPSDSGAETSIELKYNFFDPVPKMKIGNDPIKLARPFSWSEYLWFVILILLMMAPPQAHPFGGLVGVLAAVVSTRVFRGNHSIAAKFGLLALITGAAFVALVLLIVLLSLVTGVPQR